MVDRGQYLRPLVHWMAVRTGAIPVENDPRDLGSLRRALLALKQGAVLGIFPEGGRSDDGSLKTGKPGAALLALRAGVPLIPAGLVGTFAAYSRHHRFPRPKPILVRFGEPLDLPAGLARSCRQGTPRGGHGPADGADQNAEQLVEDGGVSTRGGRG